MDTVPQSKETTVDISETSYDDLSKINEGVLRVISEEDEIALKQFLNSMKNNEDFQVVPEKKKGGKKKKRNLGKTRRKKKKRRKTKKYKR